MYIGISEKIFIIYSSILLCILLDIILWITFVTYFSQNELERLFLAVPWGCLQFVIVVFPDHTHLLFLVSE